MLCSPAEARIQSFELAFRIQAEATDAFDGTREPRTRELSCLLCSETPAAVAMA
jgi:hypothetical protein